MKYEQYKVNAQYRKVQNKENKAVEVQEASQCSSSLDSSFSNKQTFHSVLTMTYQKVRTKSRSDRKIS